MTGTLPRRAAAALLLACACAAAGQARQIPPQDAPPIFRVEVDAVEIDAVVTNATGKQFAANDVAAIVHVGRGRASAAHLVAVLAGASLAAQSPSPFPAVPRDMTQKTAPAASAIRGRVVDAATGAPLRRVQVQVIEMSTPAEPATALTDDEGRYELGPLPAGRYQLQAIKGGYVDMQYGQRRAFEQGRPIVLEEAQTLDRVDFALPRGAVLTGRVVDEAGEPVTGAYVQAGRYRYVDGNRRLTAERGDTTDDRGEYRITACRRASTSSTPASAAKGVPPAQASVTCQPSIRDSRRRLGRSGCRCRSAASSPGSTSRSCARRPTPSPASSLPRAGRRPRSRWPCSRERSTTSPGAARASRRWGLRARSR